VQPRRRVEARHHAGRFDTIKAAVADEPPHHGTVLLFNECLVILLVGARARHLDFSHPTPPNHDVVHECAVVVEVSTTDQPWEQALRPPHRLDDKTAVTRNERQAFGPTRCDVHHRQRLDERARHTRAAVRYQVDLAEPRSAGHSSR